MIFSILISLMISFGFISSASDYNNLDQNQQDAYESIIIQEDPLP